MTSRVPEQPTQEQLDQMRAAGIEIPEDTSRVSGTVEGVSSVTEPEETGEGPTQEQLDGMRAAGIEIGEADVPVPEPPPEVEAPETELTPTPEVTPSVTEVVEQEVPVTVPVTTAPVHQTQEQDGVVYAIPGSGDQWITEDDYSQLTQAQRSVYDREGYDALIDYMYQEYQQPQGLSVPALQPRIVLTPEIKDAWQKYIDPSMVGYGEGQLHPYQVAEALVEAGAPPAVVYAYVIQNFEAQRGSVVGRFIDDIKKQFDAIIGASDEEQFKAFMALGFIPEGSEFVPALTEEQIQQIQAESVGGSMEVIEELSQLQPHGWYYQTPEELASIKESAEARGEFINWLVGEAPEELRLAYLRGGVEGYNTAVEEMEEEYREAQRLARDFEESHQRPGAGDQWITKEDYNSLSPELQAIYDKEGYTAMAEERERRWQELNSALAPYTIPYTPSGAPWKHEKIPADAEIVSVQPAIGGYDISRYLRDHDNDDAILLAFGFSKDDIEEAKKWNSENPWAYETIMEKYHNAVREAGGDWMFETPTLEWLRERYGRVNNRYWYEDYDKEVEAWLKAHPDVAEIRQELAEQTETPPPRVEPHVGESLETWTANWLAVRGIEPADEIAYGLGKLEASNAYSLRYGSAATGRSIATQLTAMVFSPARVMYPEVEFRDISGAEWAIAGAQLALIVAPALSIPFRSAGAGAQLAVRATSMGIQAGAAATFATVTGLEWGNMSPAERVLSVSLNTLIIGSILHGSGLLSKAGRTTRNLLSRARTNFTQALRRSGVEARAVSEADQAMQQILRGIETGDTAMIQAGEARLQTAMRSQTVPAEIRRMISDGGSYIRNNAVDYQRLISTTRRLNYSEISRTSRVGRVSDTAVSNQALDRMVKLSDNELANVRATQTARLEQLRQSYIREIQNSLERRAWNAVKAQQALDRLYAEIEGELSHLRKFGMTTAEQTALMERLDLQYLRKLAKDVTRIRSARQLQIRESTVQAELERLRRTGFTTNQERAVLRQIEEGLSKQELARIRELRTLRAVEQRELAIQAELEKLKATGMTTNQQQAVWRRLDEYVRSMERTKLARIKEAQALATEEQRLEALLKELRARGTTATTRANINQQIDDLMRQLDRLRAKQLQNRRIIQKLDETFNRVNTATREMTSAEATVTDIEAYLKEKPVEPAPSEEGFKPAGEEPPPPERRGGGGVAVKERVRTRLKPTETKTKEMTEVKPETKKATRTTTATRVDTRTRQKIIGETQNPEVQAIASAYFAGLGWALPTRAPAVIPIPEKVIVPMIMPTISPATVQAPSVTGVPSPFIAPSVAPSATEFVSPEMTPSMTPSPYPEPEPSPYPEPEPMPQPEPQPKPEPRPKPTPPPPTPGGKIWPPRPQLSGTGKVEPKKIPEGSVAFAFGKRKGKQGKMVPQWYYVPPPYNMRKPVSLSAPPVGAQNAGSVNPYDTIQVIGQGRVPPNISIDMGIVDAFITDSGRRIKFGGKGQTTDVGPRVESTTTGMGVEESGDYIDEDIYGTANTNRRKVKLVKKRKLKKESGYLYGMQGQRI